MWQLGYEIRSLHDIQLLIIVLLKPVLCKMTFTEFNEKQISPET